jgi:hypothetical protein
LQFPQSIETNSITLACAEVQGLSSQEYLPGKTYYWDIRIEVDQNIAPYVQTLYGRLRHKIQVSLDWSTPQTWWLKSGTVQTEETVTIISVPPISNILSYSLTRQELVKHLGLIDCHLYSHHLTIGSKVFFRLALPSNASYCDIVRIEMAVLQYTTLRSRKKPGLFFYTDTPQRCSILTVDRENLKQRMQEGGFLWSARLPSCHVLGPSTLPGTKGAAIRLSHKLEMIIEYRPNDRGVIRNRSIKDTPLVHKVEWPVVLPSVRSPSLLHSKSELNTLSCQCACQSESLNLPAYSRDDTVQVSPINSDIRANRPQIAKCSCRSHTTRDDSDIKDLTLSLQDINLSQAMLAGAKSFDSVPKALYHSRRLAAAAVDADIVM